MPVRITPLRVLIAAGISVSAVINYNEFFGDDSPPMAAAATQAIATPPPASAPSPTARSPLERLKYSAEAGNINDQLTLAKKYSTGDGVAKDQAEASRWYAMAARGGNMPAMYELSMRYRHGYGLEKNSAEATVWRQRAASGGHPEAALEMAHSYASVTTKGAVLSNERSNDAGESSRQLVSWLTRAFELGSLAAKHELALVRLYGISKGGADQKGYLVPLPSVVASAIELLTEAAEAGYWESQYALAELYQIGYADLKPSHLESNKWWQRLDAQTDASVQASIGRRYLASDANKYRTGENKWKGKSLSHDATNKVAFEWFSRAATQADKDALWQLAVMEYSGLGTSKNPARALELHQKATELGQLDAMYQLGVAYTNGSGVQKDYANALQWLARSVAHEGAYGANPVRSQAQNAIGLIYENGYGVAKDLVLAYAWYNLASTDGSQEIQKNLTRVAELLKPEQLVEAEGLARGWKAGNQITRRT